MTTTYDVGPFQDVEAINFPAQEEVAYDIGAISAADVFFNYVLQCTCAKLAVGQCNDFFPFPSYRTSWFARLSAPLETCDQTNYTVVGRSSGVSFYMGVREKAKYGLDCTQDNCFVDLAANIYSGSAGWGAWVPSQQYWSTGNSVYTLGKLNYSNGERINLLFSPPSIRTMNITQRSASTIFINADQPHGLLTGMWIEIMGTQFYDGFYDVFYVDANRLWVFKTYAIDDTGTFKYHYSYGAIA